MIRLFTDGVSREWLWVVFRDVFVDSLEDSLLLDFMVNGDALEGATGDANEAAGAPNRRLSPQNSVIDQEARHSKRPAILYLTEAVVKKRSRPSQPADSAGAQNDGDFDGVVWLFLELNFALKTDSAIWRTMRELLEFVQVESRFFESVIQVFEGTELRELSILNGDWLVVLVEHFFESQLEYIEEFGVGGYFGLVRKLRESMAMMLRRATSTNMRFISQKWPKSIDSLRSISELEEFVSSLTRVLVPREVSRILQMLLAPDARCSAFFLDANEQFRESLHMSRLVRLNRTALDIGLTDRTSTGPKMTILSNPSQFAPSLQSSTLAPFYELNREILEQPFIYQRIKLALAPDCEASGADSFTAFTLFLFEKTLEMARSGRLEMNERIGSNLASMASESRDPNLLANAILSGTGTLGSSFDLVSRIVREPGNGTLRLRTILTDKYIHCKLARTEGDLDSRETLFFNLNLDELENELQAFAGLVSAYEVEADFESRLKLVLDIRLCLALFFRSINELDDGTVDDLISFLLADQTDLGDLSNPVRNSLLISVLGILQDKFDFLDEQRASELPPVLSQVFGDNQFDVVVVNRALQSRLGQAESRIQAYQRESASGAVVFDAYDRFWFGVSLINVPLKLGALAPALRSRFPGCDAPAFRDFIVSLLEDFAYEDLGSLESMNPEYSKAILKLILSVVNSASSAQNTSFFLSELYAKLLEGASGTPFNYSNFVSRKGEIYFGEITDDYDKITMWECINCGFYFEIGNCGRPYYEFNCNDCDELIGGVNHRPNPNTQRISEEMYIDRFLKPESYWVHNPLEGDSVTIAGLSPFSFRIGHLLTHALFAGLTMTGLVDLYELFELGDESNYRHIGVSEDDIFGYFYKHVQNDMEFVRRDMEMSGSPFDFICAILHDLLEESLSSPSTPQRPG